MKAHDRRALARLLKNADGDWNELRRSYEAEPQPGRGRPLGAAKKMDDYLLAALPRFLKIAKKQKLAPHAAIKSLLSDVHNYEGARCFAISLARASSWPLDACIERTKTANVDGN